MEGLVFLLRLVAIVAAAALVLVVIRRRGGVLPGMRQARPRQCPHLGMATDPFSRDTRASDEHRCYASMARERIDLSHQRQFCLTSTHNRCPFLLVQTQQEGLLARIWAWRRIVSPVRQARPSASAAGVGAMFLAIMTPLVTAVGDAAEELARLDGSSTREFLAQAPRIAAHVLMGVLQGSRIAVRLIMPRLKLVVQRVQFVFSQTRSRRRSAKLVQRLAAARPHVEATPVHLQTLVAPAANAEVAPLVEAAAAVEVAPIIDLAPRVETAARMETSVVRGRDCLERGIAALEAGHEVEARALFKRATELDSRAARGWFWRAKTADSLDEVIACLERANGLEPDNALIASNLVLTAQRREALRTNPVPVTLPPGRAEPATSFVRRSGLVHRTLWAAIDVSRAIGALAAFLLGTTWLLGALPPGLRAAIADSSGLQSLPLPDARALTGLVQLAPVGGYELGSALPYGIGFLALFIGLGLLGDERWTRLWAPLLGIASGWVWLSFPSGAGPEPLILVACGLVAVAGAVTGWTILPGGSSGRSSMVVRSAHALAA